MNDFGDNGGAGFEEGRVRSWEFAAVDGVEGSIFEKEGEQGRDAMKGE